jgi:serine/threonine-protein kinase
MSPEQARGEPIDKRTDIWSFGCVLYELLTGRRAAGGATVSETLTAVVESDPDWTAMPASVPVNIQRLVRRCLVKDPKRRLKDIGDVRLELEEFLDARGEAHATVDDHVGARRGRGTWPWIAAAVAVVGGLLLFSGRDARREPPSELRRVSAELGTDAFLVTLQFGQGSAITLSPDGRALAFVAQSHQGAARQIYVRKLDELRAAPISGTDGALNPFFSPDGRWIGFFADGKLKKVPTAGGGAIVLCSVLNNRGGAWGADGLITFSPDREGAALWQVSSSGGEPYPVTSLSAGETTHRWPQILLGGKAVLFTANGRPDGFEQADVVVQSLPNGPRKILVRGGAYYGRYLPSGHLVYVHNDVMFAAPFDLDRLELAGPPVPALEGVTLLTPVGAAEVAFSDAGTVAYLSLPTTNYMDAPIDWIDRSGTVKPLRSVPARWFYPRFTPDGRQIAFTLFDGTQYDIWTYDWSLDEMKRLTVDSAGDAFPLWTPNGFRLVFQSARGSSGPVRNLYWQRADGVGQTQRLTQATRVHIPESWHPRQPLLAFSEIDSGTGTSSVMMLRVDGDEVSGWHPGVPSEFLKDAESPVFSPDGRWLAYTSKSSSLARTEVFVRPFPGSGGPWQVSTDGGASPVWSLKRPELFYSTPENQIMVASYSGGDGSFHADKPRVLPGSRFSPRVVGRSFDVHPDGDRLALVKAAAMDAAARPHITLIFNFLDELRKVAP